MKIESNAKYNRLRAIEYSSNYMENGKFYHVNTKLYLINE